jgi:ABC-type multidrug transport system ATPase subunit
LKVILEKAGKRFNSEWIFRGLSYNFEKGQSYAILGRNGSGKSTLLQVISGSIHPTEGLIKYYNDGRQISEEKIFRYLSCSAPYLELIEEFRLREMLQFHFRFKELLPGYSVDKAIDLLGFRGAEQKPIKQFSSGMKQRVKLILAFLSDTPLLLLDEPTTNLDRAGMDWYLNLITEFTKDRTVIICSNLQQLETGFCKEKLLIEDYK